MDQVATDVKNTLLSVIDRLEETSMQINSQVFGGSLPEGSSDKNPSPVNIIDQAVERLLQINSRLISIRNGLKGLK